MSMIQLHNGHHHHRKIKQKMYTYKCFLQVETTITKYKGGYDAKTKTDSKIGISYLYDKKYGFTRKFPVFFCGCFKCGGKYLLVRYTRPKGNTQSDREEVVFQCDVVTQDSQKKPRIEHCVET